MTRFDSGVLEMRMKLDGYVVLVAEDEVLIGMHITAELEEAGLVVIGPQSTVVGAMASIDGRHVDVAVLDLVLGSELVYPLADILAARGIPFIFATGIGGDKLPPEYARAPVCEKPFAPGSIVCAVSEAIRNNFRLAAA
jgi:DNA-binding response OmpR family regulator